MSENLPDLKAVIERVRKIAAENPDFIYNYRGGSSCDYVRSGKPSCILGQAFYAEGVSIETLEEWDDTGTIDSVLESLYPEYLESSIDVEDLEWLTDVQQGQDSQLAWSASVETADTRLIISRVV